MLKTLFRAVPNRKKRTADTAASNSDTIIDSAVIAYSVPTDYEDELMLISWFRDHLMWCFGRSSQKAEARIDSV